MIVYPVKDENPLLDVFDDVADIKSHLNGPYRRQDTLVKKGDYQILFVWNLNGHRMTDVWIHDMQNWSDSGPLVSCQTFRDLEVCHDAGIASGDSLIVLGKEEELRRELANIDQYLDREKHFPQFPSNMSPTDFFSV